MPNIIFFNLLIQFLEQHEAETAIVVTLFFMCVWAAVSERKGD